MLSQAPKQLGDFIAIAEQYKKLCDYVHKIEDQNQAVEKFLYSKNWGETGAEIERVLVDYERSQKTEPPTTTIAEGVNSYVS